MVCCVCLIVLKLCFIDVCDDLMIDDFKIFVCS